MSSCEAKQNLSPYEEVAELLTVLLRPEIFRLTQSRRGERIGFMRLYPIRILLLFSALATACTTAGVTPDVTNKNQPRSAVATDAPTHAGDVDQEPERRLKPISDRPEEQSVFPSFISKAERRFPSTANLNCRSIAFSNSRWRLLY